MTTKVVIFNGPPNSGKDEAAKFLVEDLISLNFSAKHLEFKGTLFKLVKSTYGITEEVWSELYTRENKELPSYFLVYNGSPISPRQALINMSEKVIKPLYGDQAFGIAASNSLDINGINIFSDGGFDEELKPIINKIGSKNVLVVKLSREGCSFNNDSRDYLNTYSLGVACKHIYNDSTLDNFLSECEVQIKGWLV